MSCVFEGAFFGPPVWAAPRFSVVAAVPSPAAPAVAPAPARAAPPPASARRRAPRPHDVRRTQFVQFQEQLPRASGCNVTPRTPAAAGHFPSPRPIRRPAFSRSACGARARPAGRKRHWPFNRSHCRSSLAREAGAGHGRAKQELAAPAKPGALFRPQVFPACVRAWPHRVYVLPGTGGGHFRPLSSLPRRATS